MIFPSKRNPYYIVSPGYTPYSAGVKVLHHLCHALSLAGERAYIVSEAVNVDLLTPVLTPHIVDFHFEQRLQPITIYPEVIKGNPLHSDIVIRYILNFIGLLGGPTSYPDSDILCYYGYGFKRPEDKRASDTELFLPIENPKDYMADPNVRKIPNKNLYYAKKFKNAGGIPFGLPEGAIEIPGYQNAENDHKKYKDNLQSAEALYVYEDTGVSINALFLGTPVIYKTKSMPFSGPGITNISDPDIFRKQYEKTIEDFPENLSKFIEYTQDIASKIEYKNKIYT